jgi:hypothetical protein
MSLFLIGWAAASAGNLTTTHAQFERHSITTVDLTVAEVHEKFSLGNKHTYIHLIFEFSLRACFPIGKQPKMLEAGRIDVIDDAHSLRRGPARL